MADSSVSKLPLLAQLGISIGLGVVVLGGFYYFVYKDMVEEAEKKTSQLENLNKDIAQLVVITEKLPDFQREVSVLEMKLETLKRILPPEKETPDLVRKLQNLAAESQLRIKQFNPGSMVSRDFYQEFPINLEVDGTYHNLASFFDRMSRLTRVVNATGLRIAAKTDQTPSLSITAQCTATTYVYVEAAATAMADDKTGKKRQTTGKAAQ
jgi:type IV pilus assembly protein PilO